MTPLMIHFFNFAIVVAVLVVVAKKALINTFTKQRKDLELKLHTSQAQEKRSQLEFDQTKSLVDALPLKIKEIQDSAIKAMEIEDRKIREEAVFQSERIVKENEVMAMEEWSRVKDVFQKKILESALIKAEKTMQSSAKIQSEDWVLGMIREENDLQARNKNYAR